MKSLESRVERSLRLYLESSHPGCEETWDSTKYKLELIKNINKM